MELELTTSNSYLEKIKSQLYLTSAELESELKFDWQLLTKNFKTLRSQFKRNS